MQWTGKIYAVFCAIEQVLGMMEELQADACRDDSPLVGVEAIKALAGWFPPRTSQLQPEGESPPDDVSDLRMRSRAWQVNHAATCSKADLILSLCS